MGSTIATGLWPKKAASAIAIMFSGLTIALVTGVPLGTWIGQVFGWRETFLVVSLLGLVAMVGSLLLIPNNLPKGAASTIREQLSVLTKSPCCWSTPRLRWVTAAPSRRSPSSPHPAAGERL